jgi:hypothetical protein
MSWARQLTYLVADLRPGLLGLGGAFFILLFNPVLPAGSVLDVARPCTLGAGWAISTAYPPGNGAVVAFGDCTSPSLSSTSMVWMSELIVVVVFADTADLFYFPLLFFAFAIWATAWKATIFPAGCRMRRGAATLDGSLHDVVGPSLSLPTIESEMYSSTGGGGTAWTSATSCNL